MTIYTSQMISGIVGQQLAMFSGYGGFAQQFGVPGQQMPMMPQLNAIGSMRQGIGGMYGEQLAMRMANVGRGAMGVGGAGMGILSAFSPIPLDPFSGGIMGMMRGGGFGGGIAGAGVGAAAALPIFAATQAAQVYGGAFSGGMQDQAALNSTLRSNFSHFGGQGAFGRGFSQAQMGQVGQMVSGELRRNPFTSATEMNQLIAGGADSGMFTAVRDVQQFTQKFKQMLNTLKDVQRELGGTLTDALQFVRGSQQAGIFRNADQVNFAAEIRSAEAVTGMDRNQLIALSAQGAQISRAFGGAGRQGAMGAVRGAQTLGAAIQSGTVNQELLSEATGGLTGADAIGAFTQNMMARSGRFSRTGMGRFSLFALSNSEGTGLDAGMMARFNAGDLSVSDVSRTAHRNVRSMGRARAINSEGMLRGAVMEEGGMASQIGMMRLMVGDRVLDQNDDLASLVLQRRFKMSRPESELMMNLMRNQGNIATEEAMTSRSARRQTDVSRDITENRSMDAFMRQLEHGIHDAAGVTRVREMGRSFMTRISSLAERAMNDILGVSASTLTRGDEAALNRMFLGRSSASDIARLDTRGAGGDLVNAQSLFDRPLAQDVLHALPFGIGHHAPLTPGESLSRRGVRGLQGGGAGATARDAIEQARAAQSGFVMGDSRLALERLDADSDRTMRRISQATLMAAGLEDQTRFYQLMGGDANAIDAFMAQRGMRGSISGAGGVPTLANIGSGGRVTGGMVGRDVMRSLVGIAAGPAGMLAMAAMGENRFESLGALQTPEESAAGFFTGGNRAFRREMMLRSEGRTGDDVQSSVDFIRSVMGDRPTEEVDRAVTRALSTRENRAALMLEGVENVRREDMEAVLGSEEFQRRAREILGAGEGLGDRLESLRTFAGTLESEGQRTAVMSLAEQIEQGAGTNGQISGPLRRALESAGFDPRRIAEIRTRRADMAGDFRAMARGITAQGGEGLADLSRAFEGAGTALSGEGDPTEAVNAARTALSTLDTNDPRFQQASRALGSSEGGRALLSAAAQDRHMRRSLSGRGRRGSAEMAETAFGAITGGSLSEMEFSIGGRTIRGSDRNAARRLMGVLRGGGEGQAQLMNQLQTQLEGIGVGRDEAMSMIGNLSAGVSDGGGRGMNARNIEELIRQTGGSEALTRVRAEGTARMQRERDPLGHERNQILGRMETLLGTIRDRLPAATSSESTGEAQ